MKTQLSFNWIRLAVPLPAASTFARPGGMHLPRLRERADSRPGRRLRLRQSLDPARMPLVR
jgi:hypothetical protein